MLKPGRPTKEMKSRLVHEIAQEHGVEWSVDQGNEPRITDEKNGWMVIVQEMINNDWEEDEPKDDDDDKKKGWMVSVQETINDDSNGHEEDLPDDDVETSASPKRVGNKENEDVSNDRLNIGKWDDENVIAEPFVKNKPGYLPHAKLHMMECLQKLLVELNERAAKCHLDSMVNPRSGHVHPKLPNYDDIVAQFAAIKANS